MMYDDGGTFQVGNADDYQGTNYEANLILDVNSRISLSNNDSGGTGGSDSTTANTIFGYLAGGTIDANTIDNTFIGHKAGGGTKSDAQANTAIGSNSLSSLTSGDSNTAVGYQTGNDITIGSNNTILGFQAGATGTHDITGGSNNTLIGYQAKTNNANASNQIVIGKGASGVADNSVNLGNASVTAVYIAKGNDTSQDINFFDSAGGGGNLQYTHADDQMKFGVADAVRARLFADTLRPGANDTQDLGTASAGWRTLYVTDGINFPDDASANPSSDANTLDNYEEGTWTPTVSFSTGSGTVAYNIQQGTYTKIGNIVHITGRVRTTDIAERTGTVAIAGLPFTANATYFPAISIALGLGLTITANQALTGYVNASSTVINLQIWETTAGTNMLVHTDWSDGGSISFTTSYRV